MVVEFPEIIKNLDKKYRKAPKQHELMKEKGYGVNVYDCQFVPLSCYLEAKQIFSLNAYHGFNPNIELKTEQNLVVKKEKETGCPQKETCDKKKDIESSSEKNQANVRS